MKKALAGLCLLCMTGAVQASGLDLTLGDETASLALLLNGYDINATGTELALGGFISERDDTLLFASLMARGTRIGVSGNAYRLGAGLKFVRGDLEAPEDRPAGADDSESIGAAALGFQWAWISPGAHSVPSGQNRRSPWEFGFNIYYAPKIASFSDAENYLEMSARIQIEIIPTAQAYVGFRRIAVDTNDYSDLKPDDSMHVGLKVRFQ